MIGNGLIFPSADEAKTLYDETSGLIADASDIESAAIDILTNMCVGISPELESSIKRLISQHTSTSEKNIYVTGSCRLGFSPIEKNTPSGLLLAGRPFSVDSDIDIAIVDNDFYNSIWERLFMSFPTLHARDHGKNLARYHLRGWLRPDFMPYSSGDKKAIRITCANISKILLKGQISASIGIWKNDLFFIDYFKSCLTRIN